MVIYEALMGNPFVDAGVSAMCAWLDRNPEEITKADLEKMIGEIAPIMQTNAGWANLHSIFPNSVLTNSSFSKRDRVDLLKKLCGNYLEEIEELGKIGDCIGCGRREANVTLKRENVPMTGSGALLNFFPTFVKGVGYCAACALAIQISPLAFVATGGKFLMLHSNSWKAQRFWTRKCVGDIRQQMLRKEITGCFNPGYFNAHNGLFFMAGEMIAYAEGRFEENITMQLYHFSNYGQSPELDYFQLPARVFNFLRHAHQAQFKKAWREIVLSGYQYVNWKKVASEEDYKNRQNSVYESLLEGKSILQFFLNRKARKARGNWELISHYLKEVHRMDAARLETIKRVGDLIAESIRKSERDRRLRQLESAKNYRDCRNILRFVIKERIAQAEPEPLFSLDEYVNHLFPEMTGDFTQWSETRDLLVFRIYETLHDWLKDRGLVGEVDEDEETEEPENRP
jgi:CRISPR-associated protein Cst1